MLHCWHVKVWSFASTRYISWWPHFNPLATLPYIISKYSSFMNLQMKWQIRSRLNIFRHTLSVPYQLFDASFQIPNNLLSIYRIKQQLNIRTFRSCRPFHQLTEEKVPICYVLWRVSVSMATEITFVQIRMALGAFCCTNYCNVNKLLYIFASVHLGLNNNRSDYDIVVIFFLRRSLFPCW